MLDELTTDSPAPHLVLDLQNPGFNQIAALIADWEVRLRINIDEQFVLAVGFERLLPVAEKVAVQTSRLLRTHPVVNRFDIAWRRESQRRAA